MIAASEASSDLGAEPGADRALFVYGVVGADARIPDDLAGLDGSAVTVVRHGAVAAVVGEIALDRPPGRRADLVAYSEVLDALAAAVPVAPVQFGSVLADERAVVEDFLAPQETDFARVLDELAGRRQFNLRATYVEDVVLSDVVATDPEVRDLRERTRNLPEEASYGDRVRLGELVARELEDRSAYDAGILLDAVLPLVVAHAARPASGLDQVLDVALLVEEDQVDTLLERLEELAEAVHERIRLRLVGPVPAYDFVGGT